MKPTEQAPVKAPEAPKVPENYEPFDEDYSMDAEEEQVSMSQEACDDFDTEERAETPSSPEKERK
jgi:hypothetical protein